jgi:hypothetical protein
LTLGAAQADTFEAVARECFGKFSVNWANSHSSKVLHRLEMDLFPWLGSRPVGQITPPELLTCLRRVEKRGALDTAHRVHQNCWMNTGKRAVTGSATSTTSST